MQNPASETHWVSIIDIHCERNCILGHNRFRDHRGIIVREKDNRGASCAAIGAFKNRVVDVRAETQILIAAKLAYMKNEIAFITVITFRVG